MGYPLPLGRFAATDNLGNPLAGGRVYTYEAGTDDELPTYSDAALTVENANPVILDGYGRASIYIPGGVPYKIIVKDSADALIYSEPVVEVPDTAEAPVAAAAVPAGTIAHWGGGAAPAGWVLCDGAAYERAHPTYAALFAAIGTTYGPGNGSTTFNVPSPKGRFLLGKADAGTGSVLGQTGGALDHLHTGPSHTHTMPDHTHTVPAHTHSVPRDGWGNADVTPPVAGRLQAGGSGTGSESTVQQATQDNTTGASSAAVTGAAGGGNTGASGTGNTSTANPAYLVTNIMIKL
jgi:microcystin-dependent protein